MKFPKLSFKDALMQRAWEDLRKYMLQFAWARDAENGKPGSDGKDGADGESCTDWVDITVSASPYTVTDDQVNRMIYFTNTSGAMATVNLPSSKPGYWLCIMNASPTTGSSTNISVVPGSGITGIIISAGNGAYHRSDGMGRWLTISMTGGTPTTRVY